ncbi:hypothetical protein JTP77_023970 [Streptomyces sp. S9]|nr:hypothetical protein [Streptomyces sp. S9]
MFDRPRWHWIITIAWKEGGMWNMVTATGSCAPRPGHTRDGMHNLLYDQTVARAGAKDAYVVFFSLEPDALVSE